MSKKCMAEINVFYIYPCFSKAMTCHNFVECSPIVATLVITDIIDIDQM